MSEMMVRNGQEGQLSTQNSMSSQGIVYTPRFDIWETDDELVLVGDLPGVTPENLDIQLDNQELKVWGKVPPRQPTGRAWSLEYGVGDYYRTFMIGDAIDAEAISAELKDGVLKVHLPKRAEARPRRIEVKTT